MRKGRQLAKMNGGLASVDAPHLGAALVKDAIATTGINPGVVDEIIVGQVLTAGVGQAQLDRQPYMVVYHIVHVPQLWDVSVAQVSSQLCWQIRP